MMRQIAWVAAAALALAACSGSDAPETPGTTPGGLDRIDGPAVVDPSYDPSQVDPAPVVTEPAG
jgi:hypothetical protein